MKNAGAGIEFLIDQALAHWRIDKAPSSLRHTSVDQKQLLHRLELLTRCLNTLQYALGGHDDPEDPENFYQYFNFPTLITLLGRQMAGEDGRAILIQFVRDAAKITGACVSLMAQTKQAASKRGPGSHVPYDFFVEAVMQICEKNGIRPTISTDRISSKRGGRFLEIAKRLELLLPPPMRSPSDEALAKRLVRSRSRIEASYHFQKKMKCATSRNSNGSKLKDFRFDF